MALEMEIQMEFETFPEFMQRVMIVSVLVTSFFVYPSLCQAILNTFACYPLDKLPHNAPQYLYPLNSLVRDPLSHTYHAPAHQTFYVPGKGKTQPRCSHTVW